MLVILRLPTVQKQSMSYLPISGVCQTPKLGSTHTENSTCYPTSLPWISHKGLQIELQGTKDGHFLPNGRHGSSHNCGEENRCERMYRLRMCVFLGPEIKWVQREDLLGPNFWHCEMTSSAKFMLRPVQCSLEKGKGWAKFRPSLFKRGLQAAGWTYLSLAWVSP